MRKEKEKVKKPRRFKNRFIFLNLMLVIFILASLAYVDYVGDHYVMRSSVYVTPDTTVNEVLMSCSKDDIVILNDFKLDKDGQIILYLESDESGDIDELQGRGRELLRLIDLRELFQTRIRNGDDADILVDRAERIVCGFRAGICQCIEQCAFADIRQSDHTKFHRLLYSFISVCFTGSFSLQHPANASGRISAFSGITAFSSL